MKPTRFVVCAEDPSTVTAKLPLDELPAASVAVQPTVLVPIGNVLPEAGAHAIVGDTPELSVAVTDETPLKITGFRARDAAFEGAQKYSDWKCILAAPAQPAAAKPAAKPPTP